MSKKAYMKPVISKSIGDQLEGVFACTGQIEGSNQGGSWNDKDQSRKPTRFGKNW